APSRGPAGGRRGPRPFGRCGDGPSGRLPRAARRATLSGAMNPTARPSTTGEQRAHWGVDVTERGRLTPPKDAASNDPEVLRAALIRESNERRRAEGRARVETAGGNAA